MTREELVPVTATTTDAETEEHVILAHAVSSLGEAPGDWWPHYILMT